MFERRPRRPDWVPLADYPAPLQRAMAWYDGLTDWERVKYAVIAIVFLIACAGYLLGLGSTMLLQRVEAEESALAAGPRAAVGQTPAPEPEIIVATVVLPPTSTPTTAPSATPSAVTTPTPFSAPQIAEKPVAPRVAPVTPAAKPAVEPQRTATPERPRVVSTATSALTPGIVRSVVPEPRTTPAAVTPAATAARQNGTPPPTARPNGQATPVPTARPGGTAPAKPATTPTRAATAPAATQTPRAANGTPAPTSGVRTPTVPPR